MAGRWQGDGREMVGRCTQLTEDKGLMEVCGLCSMGWAGRVLMIWRRARVVDLLRGRVHHNDLVHGLVELRCHPLGVAEALLHVLGHLLYLVEVGWAKRTVAMTARNPVRSGCGAGAACLLCRRDVARFGEGLHTEHKGAGWSAT